MLVLHLAVLAAACLVEAADDYPSRNIHGAVAFIRTGERTPLISAGSKKLTALGAQQMHHLGQMLRGRYMGDEAYNGLGQDPINGLMSAILDPDQLFIQTLDRPYLQASAQALLQGLFPSLNSNGSTESVMDPSGILANGTVIEAPLSGYQYAPIQVVSEYDFQSIYIAGNENCPLSTQASLAYQSSDEYMETREASDSFYASLDTSLFDGAYREQDINYFNAFEIYDYLSYAYLHDRTTHTALNNDAAFSGVFDQLKWYADESSWYFYGNTSSSSRSDGDIRAMAGKTLIARTLGQLQKIINNGGSVTNGNSQPLTLLFGDHEPLISLFSHLGLDELNENFRAVPPFGSTFIFELFSIGRDGDFPTDASDLWVDTHFQNGTDYKGSLTSYPIFGNGPSHTDIPWLEFQDAMSRVMTNSVRDWCSACSSYAVFCEGVFGDERMVIQDPLREGKEGGSGVSNVVAGVIGAVVTLAVAGIVFALAMLVGGVRFRRVERRRDSGLGGFKGSAKLASDPDLSLAKNGAVPAGATIVANNETNKSMHERAGSWELRQKEGRSGDLGDEGIGRRGSFEEIEAAMGRPVEPTERV